MKRIKKLLKLRGRKTNTGLIIAAVILLLKFFGVPVADGAEETTADFVGKVLDLFLMLDGLFVAYGLGDKCKRVEGLLKKQTGV